MHRTTKLTNKEINQIGRDLGIDWDKLAGLMDIPYSEQEEIRASHDIYLSLSSKAKRVLELYNASKHFDRRVLVRYLEEIGRHDLENKMLPIKDEVICDLKFFLVHHAIASQSREKRKYSVSVLTCTFLLSVFFVKIYQRTITGLFFRE